MVYFSHRYARRLYKYHYKLTLQKLLNFKMTIKLIFQVACILYPECNFLHRYLRCQLPEEMVDVEVKVKTMQGILHLEGTGHLR